MEKVYCGGGQNVGKHVYSILKHPLISCPLDLITDSFPIVYKEDPPTPLWSPGCHLSSDPGGNKGPPTFDQIMESRLYHRRVRLNVGGIR